MVSKEEPKPVVIFYSVVRLLKCSSIIAGIQKRFCAILFRIIAEKLSLCILNS